MQEEVREYFLHIALNPWDDFDIGTAKHGDATRRQAAADQHLYAELFEGLSFSANGNVQGYAPNDLPIVYRHKQDGFCAVQAGRNAISKSRYGECKHGESILLILTTQFSRQKVCFDFTRTRRRVKAVE